MKPVLTPTLAVEKPSLTPTAAETVDVAATPKPLDVIMLEDVYSGCIPKETIPNLVGENLNISLLEVEDLSPMPSSCRNLHFFKGKFFRGDVVRNEDNELFICINVHFLQNDYTTRASFINLSTVTEWMPGRACEQGDVVSYKGVVYRCDMPEGGKTRSIPGYSVYLKPVCRMIDAKTLKPVPLEPLDYVDLDALFEMKDVEIKYKTPYILVKYQGDLHGLAPRNSAGLTLTKENLLQNSERFTGWDKVAKPLLLKKTILEHLQVYLFEGVYYKYYGPSGTKPCPMQELPSVNQRLNWKMLGHVIDEATLTLIPPPRIMSIDPSKCLREDGTFEYRRQNISKVSVSAGSSLGKLTKAFSALAARKGVNQYLHDIEVVG